MKLPSKVFKYEFSISYEGTILVLAKGRITVVGATVVGTTVVGATVVGATVVGAIVVGATEFPSIQSTYVNTFTLFIIFVLKSLQKSKIAQIYY